MRTCKIAAMGGDGIGPEVVEAGVQVLKVCAERDGGFTLDFQDFDWGSDYYRKHGVMMPADGADQLRKFDAILFDAVGAPDIPDHITLWGLRLAICQSLDQYANVRPTRILPGITSPLRHVSGPELDWVIVRENSEGEYSGVGGRVHKGLAIEVAQDVSVMTRPEVQRVIRYAFKLAQSRPRKLLTVVTKSNAQRHAMVMWDEIAAEIAADCCGVAGRERGIGDIVGCDHRWCVRDGGYQSNPFRARCRLRIRIRIALVEFKFIGNDVRRRHCDLADHYTVARGRVRRLSHRQAADKMGIGAER